MLKNILATLALQNYLRQTGNATYTHGFVDSENADGTLHLGEWRNHGNRSCCIAYIRPIGAPKRNKVVEMCEELKKYLNSEEGSVSWQLEYIRGTYKLN